MSKIEFREHNHTYWLGDRQAVSVTRVMEQVGMVDSSHYQRSGGEDFLLRGSTIHDLTARIDVGEKIDRRSVPKRWRGFLDAWERFKTETNWQSDVVEHAVHCDEPLYAGTLDRLGSFPGARIRTVLDLKNHNSGSVGRHVRFQLVAYGHAYDPKKLFDRVGVALHPDGSYKMTRFPLTEYQADRDEFLYSVRMVYESRDFVGSTQRRVATPQGPDEDERRQYDDWYRRNK